MRLSVHGTMAHLLRLHLGQFPDTPIQDNDTIEMTNLVSSHTHLAAWIESPGVRCVMDLELSARCKGRIVSGSYNFPWSGSYTLVSSLTENPQTQCHFDEQSML